MTLVKQTTALHPEDLLDKDPEELTASERALLDAHLAQCVACRVLCAAEQDFAAELASMDAPGHASERTAAMLSKAIDTELHPEDLLEREENGEELTAAERTQLDAHLGSCVACRLLRQAQLDFEAELGADLDAPLHKEQEQEEEDLELIRFEKTLEKPSRKVVALRGIPYAGWRSRRRMGIALIAAAAVLMMASVAVAARGTAVWAVIFPSSQTQTEEAAPAPAPAPTQKPKRVGKKPAAVVGAPSDNADPETDDTTTSDSVPTNPADTATTTGPAPVAVPAPTACAAVPQQAAPQRVASQASAPLVFPSRQTPPGPMFGAYAQTAAPGTASAAPPTGAGLMFSTANDARRRGDHAAAAKLYQDLLSQYPTAPEAPATRIAMGRMMLDDGNAQGALAMFDQYLNDGNGSLREEAMSGRARAFEHLGRTDMEREAWEKLLASYPQSVHTAHAEARIKALSSH